MLGNADKSVGVFLVERRRLVREITANTINQADGVWVAGMSGGEDVIVALAASAPDIILAGYYPGMEAVLRAIADYRKGKKCAAVVLTDQSEWRTAAEIIGQDACYVSKQTGITRSARCSPPRHLRSSGGDPGMATGSGSSRGASAQPART